MHKLSHREIYHFFVWKRLMIKCVIGLDLSLELEMETNASHLYMDTAGQLSSKGKQCIVQINLWRTCTIIVQ